MKISDYFYFLKASTLPSPPPEPLPPGQLTPSTEPISIPTHPILDVTRLPNDFIQSINDDTPTSNPKKLRYAELKPFDLIFRHDRSILCIVSLSKPFYLNITHHHILRAHQPFVVHPLLIHHCLRTYPSFFYTAQGTLNKAAVLDSIIDKTPKGGPNSDIPRIKEKALAAILKAQEVIEAKRKQVALLKKLQSTYLIKWANNESEI